MHPPAGDMFGANEQKSSSEGGSGSVAIASEPAGTDIYIDGKFVGQTPSTVHLAAGLHHVEVRAQGKQTWERDLDVLKDSQLTLHAIFSD
jgi:hypothetical protein